MSAGVVSVVPSGPEVMCVPPQSPSLDLSSLTPTRSPRGEGGLSVGVSHSGKKESLFGG